MRKIAIALAFTLFVLLVHAQQPDTVNQISKKNSLGLIVGNLIDTPAGQAVMYATIRLQQLADTNRQKTVVSDKNGAFEFNKIELGYYRLKITAIGYNPLILDSIHLREERYDFNLGDLKISAPGTQLAEVIVYAEKPLIENTDGKITYNVGQSALSDGSSTSEILKNMPLVSNDPEGKILLRGKEPKILIDDKPVELSGDQLQDLLESLPGGSVEKIELMMNPPPEYATEQGGVINIVTKKGKIGWIGRITLAGGTRGEGNLSANVSYRSKKLAFTAVAGTAASQVKGNSYSRRENIYADSSNYLNTDAGFTNKNLRPNLRLQLDYEFDKHHSFSGVYQGNLNSFDNNSLTTYANKNRFLDTTRLSTRNSATDGLGYNNSVTVTYQYKGDNPAEKLRVIIGTNLNRNDNNRNYFQRFYFNDFTPNGNDSMQEQHTLNNSDNYNIRIDYNRPVFNQGSAITTGATYSSAQTHNVLETEFLRQSDGTMVPNDGLSNDFYFHQKIFTVRAGFTIALPAKWKIISGVQAEQTSLDFNFIEGNTPAVSNSYWKLMPNFTVRKEFDKTLNTSLVYRAAIRRPGIGQLNPSIDYSDPYNIRFGNPYLDASIADNFDWNISYIKGKYYINGSAGFNNIKDVFNSIRTLVGDGKTQTTYRNISNRKEYEASVWGGYTISKQLRINTSVGYTYNVYDQMGKELYKYRDGGSFYSTLNYNYTPTSLLRFEGNARFNSFADPQGRARSNVSLNLGVQRKFFDKRLIMQLNVIDPFASQKYTTFTYGPNFFLESFRASRTRNFKLTVTYQLNKMVQRKISDKEMKAAVDRVRQKS
ncbi:outer membrane beta-barrel protein [Filimonas effusa]|uniref:TonB-dependent receptor n=1 Tax=Filimonas effusa TaxID=2508721 RepID=A0A4Q1DCN0_9BACT|nr:outer membrane beta-barrel protein [Filimonas effusa]RXK86299.1 TonB-dependent receptor [Filimonas effusa]